MSAFASVLGQHGFPPLARPAITTLQINVGKVCNQACHHCHVDAGPKRTESMTEATAARILMLLEASHGIDTVDITGGAPELNPNFRRLAAENRQRGRRVIDRCNLTILLEPGFASLAGFLAAQNVEIIASLPCYTRENVDRQRGLGVFDKSIEALHALNRIGYGIDERLPLHLIYNPLGASLPPPQEALEADYKRRLWEEFGIRFHHLYALANMPLGRFAAQLAREGKQDAYARLLASRFNSQTVEHLMCRSLVSVSWDGRLYDCDFNQMLELPEPRRRTIWDLDSFDELAPGSIATGDHCFGCTAGAGSSCGGELA
ncbi:MAG: arsenosugar biosynthesis radical SAM (seleno)protein ArsS [Bryobacteraceae bacterium]